MANPKTKNGHIDIANEIADKLCSYRINGQEWQILWVILRKTWGWLENVNDKNSPKKKMDRIALSQFAKFTGINRSRCHVLLKGLIDKQIIKKTVTQKCNTFNISYGIQSNYDRWKVLPKSATVTQKCNRVLPKSATEVLPKSATTKDTITKDTITKDTITAFSENAGNTEYIYIFNFWNEKEIIKHRNLDPKTKTSIKSGLKQYTVEEITKAIENYSAVLKSERYYFNHKWPLVDFMVRGIRKFVDEADPLRNYLIDKTQGEQDANRFDFN